MIELTLLNGRRRYIDHHGYVRVVGGPNDWEYEHRLVMEQILGRRLKFTEHVHHKNHDRSDNRPDNLELLQRPKHVAHHNHIAPKRRKL